MTRVMSIRFFERMITLSNFQKIMIKYKLLLPGRLNPYHMFSYTIMLFNSKTILKAKLQDYFYTNLMFKFREDLLLFLNVKLTDRGQSWRQCRVRFKILNTGYYWILKYRQLHSLWTIPLLHSYYYS